MLIGRDVLEHRKTMRLAWSAVVGLSALTVILAVVSFVAVRARARAEEQTRIAIEQRNIAVSRQLSVQSQTYLDESLDLASLLAVEASRAKDTVEARAALLNAIQNAPQLVAYLHAHNARSRPCRSARMELWRRAAGMETRRFVCGARKVFGLSLRQSARKNFVSSTSPSVPTAKFWRQAAMGA